MWSYPMIDTDWKNVIFCSTACTKVQHEWLWQMDATKHTTLPAARVLWCVLIEWVMQYVIGWLIPCLQTVIQVITPLITPQLSTTPTTPSFSYTHHTAVLLQLHPCFSGTLHSASGNEPCSMTSDTILVTHSHKKLFYQLLENLSLWPHSEKIYCVLGRLEISFMGANACLSCDKIFRMATSNSVYRLWDYGFQADCLKLWECTTWSWWYLLQHLWHFVLIWYM